MFDHTLLRRYALLLAAASLSLGGCAATGVAPLPKAGSDTPSMTDPPAADREAILAMRGEFGVTFAFDETVALAEGYARRDPKRAGAAEAVVLVEDSGDRIVLQHLLRVGDAVIKHWRQDWTWQADRRFEFTDDQTWTVVELTPEQTRGRWTQCVYEVSDAPRYCGTGAWNHRYGSATWTSDRTWRPLPRREYTVRDDYNALNVENRHTITPAGWTHEQDNSKVVRVAGETRDVLVREYGFNEYIRTDRTDFSPVYAYWSATRDYWQRVRERWSALLNRQGLVIDTGVDGMPVIEALFELADRARRGDPVGEDAIDAVFDAYVRPLGTRIAQDGPASSAP